jgi:NAD(P)-dependent dehydrogenase (short-subunit alcohol dehydrogenase family)
MMKNKTVLVTGATAGIGRETARGLAQLGATVIVGGRDEAKTRAVVNDIRTSTGNSEVDYVLGDLSSIEQTLDLAEKVKERYKRLDVLVNNVGAVFLSREETIDGLEQTFTLNYLVGHYLLTLKLLDLLQASAPARIINVSSSAHLMGRLRLDDLQSLRFYSGWGAYGQAKLADVMFTYALARRLKGTEVTVNVLHPGVVSTNFLLTNNRNTFLTRLVRKATDLFSINEAEGAETSIYLASSPEVEGMTGGYFKDSRPAKSSPASYDQATQERLWALSEDLLLPRVAGLGERSTEQLLWSPPAQVNVLAGAD